MIQQKVKSSGQNIPRTRSLPLIGNAIPLQRDPLGFFTRVAQECGDIGRFSLGPRRMILLNSPSLIRALLVEQAQDYDKGNWQRNALRPMLGNGLLTSEGAVHQRQRKLISPLFVPRHI